MCFRGASSLCFDRAALDIARSADEAERGLTGLCRLRVVAWLGVA